MLCGACKQQLPDEDLHIDWLNSPEVRWNTGWRGKLRVLCDWLYPVYLPVSGSPPYWNFLNPPRRFVLWDWLNRLK